MYNIGCGTITIYMTEKCGIINIEKRCKCGTVTVQI